VDQSGHFFACGTLNKGSGDDHFIAWLPQANTDGQWAGIYFASVRGMGTETQHSIGSFSAWQTGSKRVY